ncbi:carboxypeptidase-like regulatory domain-containing protein [Emticicia sp. 17c]|uniref:carboxypeptidase-like regulatory domain-containing protein n=1 Tax=Emticicia sp. 17c TaxID=3127704 RepID=UPI00301C7951
MKPLLIPLMALLVALHPLQAQQKTAPKFQKAISPQKTLPPPKEATNVKIQTKASPKVVKDTSFSAIKPKTNLEKVTPSKLHLATADTLISPVSIFFQGKVTDTKNNPLPGVTVQVKGSTKTVMTDINGNFVINVKKNDVLLINQPGFHHMEINVTQQTGNNTMFAMRIAKPPAPDLPDSEAAVMEDEMPGFMIPPPQASAAAILDKDYFKEAKTLGEVDSILVKALKTAGWGDTRYYRVMDKNKKTLDGFILIAQLEQTRDDGEPMDGSQRWELKFTAWAKGDMLDYIKSLFVNRSGYFRTCVFVISTANPLASTASTNLNQVKSWFYGASIGLPASIANTLYSGQFNCTAYIYEFKQTSSQAAEMNLNRGWDTARYLSSSRILQGLKK